MNAYVVILIRSASLGASNDYHNIFFVEKQEKYQYFLVEKLA